MARFTPLATAPVGDRPAVVVDGLYSKLLDAARAAVENGDPRAVLADDDEDDDRHSPLSVVNLPAQRHLAAMLRGEPVRIGRRRVFSPDGWTLSAGTYVYADDTTLSAAEHHAQIGRSTGPRPRRRPNSPSAV